MILPVVWRSSGSVDLVRRVAVGIAWVVLAGAIGIALNPYFLEQYAVVETWVAGD